MRRLLSVVLALLTNLGLRASELPPSVFAHFKEGWGDADLSITSIITREDKSVVIEAAGEGSLGIRFVVLPTWEYWRPKGWPMDSYRGFVRLESVGKPTEDFIRCLGQAYKQSVGRIDFTSVELVAISLGGDPRSIRSGPVKLKLFFESENQEDYGEVFLNFDLSHSLIQFNEKDTDYRKPVIGFLTRGAKANFQLQTPPKVIPP